MVIYVQKLNRLAVVYVSNTFDATFCISPTYYIPLFNMKITQIF